VRVPAKTVLQLFLGMHKAKRRRHVLNAALLISREIRYPTMRNAKRFPKILADFSHGWWLSATGLMCS
jgi:hypothetical protein